MLLGQVFRKQTVQTITAVWSKTNKLREFNTVQPS